MKVLSIVSQKGGTGKTTLTTHLSVEAERNGHTIVLMDLAPQTSAAKWGDHRQADSPAVVATLTSRLKQGNITELIGRCEKHIDQLERIQKTYENPSILSETGIKELVEGIIKE